MLENFEMLYEQSKGDHSNVVAVAVPEELEVLEIIEEISNSGLSNFILVGNKDEIEKICENNSINIKEEIIDIKSHKEAAEKAVELVKSGRANTIMKGMLHTSIFMRALLDKEKGLNINKNMSQISVIESLNGKGMQLITDCAIAIKPDLQQKLEIVNNSIELAYKLGINMPKVAILSAVEVVNPKIESSIDAALISKMSERGQTFDAIVDGPLALDLAVSPKAARQKKLNSKIQGDADILVVPDLQAGNIFSKAMAFYTDRKMAAAIMGVGAPVVMTSRSDLKENKILSILLANYISRN